MLKHKNLILFCLSLCTSAAVAAHATLCPSGDGVELTVVSATVDGVSMAVPTSMQQSHPYPHLGIYQYGKGTKADATLFDPDRSLPQLDLGAPGGVRGLSLERQP